MPRGTRKSASAPFTGASETPHTAMRWGSNSLLDRSHVSTERRSRSRAPSSVPPSISSLEASEVASLVRSSKSPDCVSPVPRASGRQTTTPAAKSRAISSLRWASKSALPRWESITTTGCGLSRSASPIGRSNSSGTTIPGSTCSVTRLMRTFNASRGSPSFLTSASTFSGTSMGPSNSRHAVCNSLRHSAGFNFDRRARSSLSRAAHSA